MKHWTAILIALLALAFLVTCDKDTKRILDNPIDPESDQYIGHEISDPTDPINVPSIEITNAPTVIKINVPYTYVASASDPNPAGRGAGEIVRWDWSFGDGTILEDASPSVQHTYGAAGTFTVRVTVTDNDGNAASRTVSVTVTRGQHPVVEAGGPYYGKINVVIPLNGTTSDPDGVIVLSGWDVDRNGSIDLIGNRVNWTGTTAGIRLFDFIARDDDGNASRDSALITVTNMLPVANAGGPYTANINTPITFRGTGSDPDGRIVRYEWDFDGNGLFEWSSTTNGTAIHTYTSFWTYKPLFRVTDDDGNRATSIASFNLTANIDFSRSSDRDLFTLSGTTGLYTVTNGVFRIQGTSDEYIAKALLKNSSFISNGTIEVKTIYKSGATNHSYGIGFRSQITGPGGYGFGISANGSYVVSKWSASGEWSALKSWTSSTYINKNGTNLLKVTMQGSTFEFFINGHKVSQITDSTYGTGGAALFVGTNDMIIDFDDLAVIPQASKPARIDAYAEPEADELTSLNGTDDSFEHHAESDPASPKDPDGSRADMGAVPYQQ